jgi:glycosyltransferase involved in cell wall biosynthesis
MQATLREPLANTPALTQDHIQVSVVMPCLNEARTVGTCVDKARRELERLGVLGEVIVADNGSTDGSVDIATRHGARVVHVDRKGYGAALQGGIAAARGKYIIMGDADDSYDFSNLEPFIEQLFAGNDLVMGNRFAGGIRPGAMPWLHRYIGNPVLSGILNLFFRTPIRDAHCGLRAFRKDAYMELGLTTPGMEFASEMVVKASLKKHLLAEVPTTLSPDGRDRPPHLRSFRDGWRHLRFLLLMCPLWLYLIPSGLLMISGVALMAWLTAGPQTLFGMVWDTPTMLFGTFCVLLGYQTLWLWAFARIFGWTSGILPEETFSPQVFRHLNLERGLLAGLAVLLGGLGLNLWLFSGWIVPAVSAALRYALWGFLLMVIGVQTIYGSFFLSMLGMARKKDS